MQITYDMLDEIRQKKWLTTLINVKELLMSRKTVSFEEIHGLWQQYLKAQPKAPITLYVHTPFCLNRRCNYCGYNSDVLQRPQQLDDYINEIDKQAASFSPLFKARKLDALYLGGGTASIYSFEQLKRLYGTLFKNFTFHQDAMLNQEFSLKTIDETKLELSLSYGFTRFSLGIQSFDPAVLKLAGKEDHDLAKLRNIIHQVRSHKNSIISFDLIWGLPGDTLIKLEQSIRQGIELNPDQIMVYGFFYHQSIKDRNRDNPAYYDYTQPYQEDDVRKVLQKFSIEYPSLKFDTRSISAIVIHIRDTNLNQKRTYSTQPTLEFNNSNLGLGTHSFSFIQNEYTYSCLNFDSYLLTYCLDPSYLKIFFIQDSLLLLKKRISIEKYNRKFSSDFEEDFHDRIEFLLSHNKLRKKGMFYVPLHKDEQDLIDIGLAFLPEAKLKELHTQH